MATDTTPPAGWTNNDLDGNGILWVFNNPGDRELLVPIDYPAAIFDSDYLSAEGMTEEAVLESPTFDASHPNDYFILEFDHTFVQNLENAKIMVEVYNGAIWQELYSDTVGVGFEHVMMDMTPLLGQSAAAKVRFHWIGSWDYYWIVDNVTVTQMQCLFPMDVAISDITTTSAMLTWNPGATETEWDIEFGRAGFELGQGTSDQTSGVTEYLIDSLYPDSLYEVYVRSNCGAFVSNWVGPIPFWTACEPQSVTVFPWNVNFEHTNLPEMTCGWTTEDANNDTYTWFPFDAFVSASPPVAMYSAYNPDDPSEPMDDWLISPELELTAGTYQLQFLYAAGGGDFTEKLAVHLGTGPSGAEMTTELLDLPAIVNEDYDTATVNFEVPATGSYYLGFHGYSDADMNFLTIDDVSIDTCFNCPLAVDEQTLAEIAVYPNPTKGLLHIDSPETNGELNVSVLDFAGKEVYGSPDKQGAFDLDLSKLQSGVYFVRFSSDNASFVQRVVLTD